MGSETQGRGGKGSGRGRGGGRRSGSNRSGGGGRSGRGRKGGGGDQSAHRAEQVHTLAPRKGKAFSTPYQVAKTGAIAPLDLFCAALLGIMPDGGFKNGTPSLSEAAKRLGRPGVDVKQLLKRYSLDNASLSSADFDISLARLDVQVAPEGIDRREIARDLFEELLETHPPLRDIQNAFDNGTLEDAAPAVQEVPEASQAAQADTENPAPRRNRRGRRKETVDAPSPVQTTESPADTPKPKPRRAPKRVVEDAPEAALVSAEGSGEEVVEKRPVRRIRRSPVRRGSSEEST